MTSAKKETFIYSAVRTPIGKFNGALSSLTAPELGSIVIAEAIQRAGIQKDQIDEVIFGNVISAGVGQAPARQAALKSGLSEKVSATTINKVCGSGMKAVMMADQAIRLNQARFIVAGGMESMSQAPFLIPHMRRGRKLGNAQMIDSLIHDGLWDQHENGHMGELSDKVSQQHGISRESQDTYAVNSYERVKKAQKDGVLAGEIVPVRVTQRGQSFGVDHDEQPECDDLAQFPALPPVFDSQHGTITKGNGAKISDGAAALVIGGEFSDLNPVARIVGYATHAQAPATFALAPIEAVKKVLQQSRLQVSDIDLFEINEAFAAMSLIVHEALGLDSDQVNVHGGSIALGHPIGATGARILVTLINALKSTGRRRGVASLCIGGGEATAMIIEIV
ncbi:thiolase family protein [Candidatus Nitronereus thalassa]|uniref:Thiolase family protein n=1 Tax=Candidatus Nitronereus thalassa TaxID=3020898 RepID=A0ABU3K4G2_9BACT|nr:thiolase family protein [Candidatus Nitronereus thalassa]MDT7041292.1 thiolase family protein [Candidatus Nitronereus thalassa]